MSGTSLDGVDGVVVQFSQDGALQVLAHASSPMPPNVRDELLRLNSRQGQDELHRAALAGNAMALLYAQVVQQLLQATGLAPHAITAIGAHGQTVRHQPGAHDGVGYTLQLLNPALLAERTGITVVAVIFARWRCCLNWPVWPPAGKGLPWCRPFTSRSLPHLRGIGA